LRILTEAAGIQLIRMLFMLLPGRLSLWLGEALGWTVYHVFRFKRRQTLENLERAFGESLDEGARQRIGASVYRHFGRMVGEFILLSRATPEKVSGWMTMENPEVLDQALAENRGVLMVSGHLGNWELMSAALVSAGYPYVMYVGRQNNPFADRFINTVRSRYGAGIIPKQGGMRGMIRTLKQNHILGLLSDQHFSRNKHFVHFFSHPVSIVPGPALMYLHSRPVLLFSESWRTGQMSYRTRFTRLEVNLPGDSEEHDLLLISQAISDAVEQAVRRHPDQYFWMHRRWRPIPAKKQPTETNRRFLENLAAGKTPQDSSSGGKMRKKA
ncbi:MAG: lysophospholipid acyltransferase family protein, partial [Deltaproteobacteria bacterium]|nr:lysophospholipid acyltransferase family protein [Deltaproteobacteria bacterium]